MPLFQRRSLAPSQLAKRKAGDDEEEEEEDRHPVTVSEVPPGCGGLRGAGLAAAGLGRARPHAVAGASPAAGGGVVAGCPLPVRLLSPPSSEARPQVYAVFTSWEKT